MTSNVLQNYIFYIVLSSKIMTIKILVLHYRLSSTSNKNRFLIPIHEDITSFMKYNLHEIIHGY